MDAKEELVNRLAQHEANWAGVEEYEAARQARYKNEDAAIVAIRKREDELFEAGKANHDKVKAEWEADLTKLMNPPEKVAADQIAALQAKVAALEAAVKPAEEPKQ